MGKVAQAEGFSQFSQSADGFAEAEGFSEFPESVEGFADAQSSVGAENGRDPGTSRHVLAHDESERP